MCLPAVFTAFLTVASTDIAAIDRIFDRFGCQSELEVRTLRAARIVFL
jgi:hypothetical protein